LYNRVFLKTDFAGHEVHKENAMKQFIEKCREQVTGVRSAAVDKEAVAWKVAAERKH